MVGGRAFTSVILQKNCTEFIAYENLVSAPAPRRTTGGRTAGRAGETPALNAVPLIRRALKVLADREVSPQLGVLKSTLLQLDSTFSEREYGASTFRDFVQRLARAGYLTLKGTDRNIYVELKEGADGVGATAGGTGAASGAGSRGRRRGWPRGGGRGQRRGPGRRCRLARTPAKATRRTAAISSLTNVIEGDFGGGAGARARRCRATSPGAARASDADGGLTAAGAAASAKRLSIRARGANGSAGADEAYASGVPDGERHR